MIWNPWRRIRQLEQELSDTEWERDSFEAELGRACDRYDKVRRMNAQLRQALDLYRDSVSRTDEDWRERIAQIQARQGE